MKPLEKSKLMRLKSVLLVLIILLGTGGYLLLKPVQDSGPDDPSDRPGFDYYLLALSWSPNWCKQTGDARGADQCDARYDYGFTLHGLWPQFEQGYPSFCTTDQTPPTETMAETMVSIMGSAGLALYQWKKHGTCTGLSATEYFDKSRKAYASINRPEIFRKLRAAIRISPLAVEQAFLAANPDMQASQITITCKNNMIAEARICLGWDLELRQCGGDVAQDCRQSAAGMEMIR
jgi:ribonuclease T2